MWIPDEYEMTPMLIFLIPKFLMKNAQALTWDHKTEQEKKKVKVERWVSREYYICLFAYCKRA